MARYQVILAYDGSRFTGSQRQVDSRTVQGEFEKALRNLGWTDRSAILAGRTDTGVHASGQVAAFDFEWAHEDEKLLKALNSKLPPDLSVKGLKPASADFNPRFDAVSRTYKYRLFCAQIRDPLKEKFVWRVWPQIDGDVLKQHEGIFLGTHDFASFGSPTSQKGTTIRTLTKSEWRKKPDGEWQFEVRADAFLYRMVRRLVFVQVALAQGKCSAADVQSALKKKSKLPSGLAPAHGLILVEVSYGST